MLSCAIAASLPPRWPLSPMVYAPCTFAASTACNALGQLPLPLRAISASSCVQWLFAQSPVRRAGKGYLLERGSSGGASAANMRPFVQANPIKTAQGATALRGILVWVFAGLSGPAAQQTARRAEQPQTKQRHRGRLRHHPEVGGNNGAAAKAVGDVVHRAFKRAPSRTDTSGDAPHVEVPN